MRFVVFGLSVSSAWGNGHATLWRGLIRALRGRGHHVVFFEKNEPYYEAHRDLRELPGLDLVLYDRFADVREHARRALDAADVAMITSYCSDARAASALVLDSRVPVKSYYDLDTPVTLTALADGATVPYLPDGGLAGFDLVLSYTGGRALGQLRALLGARRAVALYGSVDPEAHRPEPSTRPRFDLSYLGTYSADRRDALAELLLAPAEALPERRFLVGGAQYPGDFPWRDNTWFVRHVPPGDHGGFYCSSALTLNVTRRAMRDFGYCPSARLFEAAACGVPIVSDTWDGLGRFFEPGEEILTAHRREDVVRALTLPPGDLARVAGRARERTLDEHTASVRARELESFVHEALARGSLPLEACAAEEA